MPGLDLKSFKRFRNKSKFRYKSKIRDIKNDWAYNMRKWTKINDKSSIIIIWIGNLRIKLHEKWVRLW